MTRIRASFVVDTTGLLVLFSLVLVQPVAGPLEAANLLQHSYYDCDWREAKSTIRADQSGDCRVYYSVEANRIGAELKDPQKAHQLPELAAADATIAGTCPVAAGAKLLELVTLDKENPSMAAYKLNGCQSEKEALWLARRLIEGSKTRSVVSRAGLLARKAEDPGQYLLVDDLLVRVAESLSLPPPPGSADLLKAVDLAFIAPDPFDPDHAALLRAIHPTTGGPGPSSLDGMDLLACVAAASGDTADVVKGCWSASAMRAQIKNNMTTAKPGATAKKALEMFRDFGPELVRPTLLPVSPKAPGADFSTWLKAEKKKEDSLTSKITFNSTSNETDKEDNARLSVDATVKKGSYPGQLRFALGAQVEFDSETVEENVTNLVVNYDHYFRPWFEIYGFVERFSNSFMGIDQRWEGGGGILLEYDMRGKSRDRFCDSRGAGHRGYSGRGVALTRRARERFAQYQDAVRDELLRGGFIKRDTLEGYCTYAPGIAKRNAKLQLSLALSAFSDFEQADAFDLTAEWADETEADPATMKLTPPAAQRLHFTVRPTITWRPSNGLEVEGWYYDKFAASSDDRPGGTDERTQATVSVDFTLSEADPKVSLTGSWTRYEDSRPPRLLATEVFEQFGLTTLLDEEGVPLMPPDPADLLVMGMDAMGRQVEIDGFVAEDEHTVVKFGVSISF